MTVCRRIEEVPKGWSATLADVDGIPSPPEPHARGKCLGCGAAMVSKTGRVRSHWAHAVSKDWDPWWETETPWHRAWKARFPENWREIAETATDGEIHRADVRTPNGLVLEFQHSSLRDDELASRNAFYPNLIWVLDGLTFKQNFEVCHPLPHPASSMAEDIAWEPAVWGMHGAMGGHNRFSVHGQAHGILSRSDARRRDRQVQRPVPALQPRSRDGGICPDQLGALHALESDLVRPNLRSQDFSVCFSARSACPLLAHRR